MTPTRNDSNEVDVALMSRSRAGEVDAFAELYDRYSGRAYRLVCSICHNVSQSEEVVQEGFLSIWVRRDSFQHDRGTFQSWAMGVFRNKAIDSVRAKAVRPTDVEMAEPLPDESGPSTSDEAISRIENASLRSTLAQLPDAQAEVIALAFFGELSQTEISDLLDLPHGTVKGRMRLGLEKLRREIPDPSQTF